MYVLHMFIYRIYIGICLFVYTHIPMNWVDRGFDDKTWSYNVILYCGDNSNVLETWVPSGNLT